MSEVKRYFPAVYQPDNFTIYGKMRETGTREWGPEGGEYVSASDYDALAARLAEAQEELAQWRATGESVTRNEHDLSARLAEAEAALALASQAIDERLSGMSGDPLQPVADEINRYFAPDSASVEGEK